MNNAKEKLLQLCKSLLRKAKRRLAACPKGTDFAANIRKQLSAAKPFCKKAIQFIGNHRVPVTALSAVLTLSMLMSVITVSIRKINVIDHGELVHSYHGILFDEEAILEKTGLLLHEKDQMIIEEQGSEISATILRAFPVTFKADGQSHKILVVGGTVEEAMKEAGLTLGAQDTLSASLDEQVFKDMTITLDRVTTETVEEAVEVAYKTIKKKTDSLYKGQTKVEQEGKNGKKLETYAVTYTNGKESKRELISSEVLEEAQEKIVLVGTKIRSSFKKTASTPTTYKKAIAMEATAYVEGGYTASGLPAKVGVVAVDPRVIPLGTKVYVETTDGKYIYGTAIAADTGGAIKGNKIDICVASHSEAYRFGRRTVNVYILG